MIRTVPFLIIFGRMHLLLISENSFFHEVNHDGVTFARNSSVVIRNLGPYKRYVQLVIWSIYLPIYLGLKAGGGNRHRVF